MKRTSILRKLSVIAGCAALVCAVDAGVSWAASAVTDGTLVAPLTITNVNPLAFGKFANNGGGTLVIGTDGVLTPTGVVVVTSPHSAASFDLVGEATTGYAITLPDSITLAGTPSGSMTVEDFTIANLAGPVVGKEATLPGTGTDTLSIGATANVEAGQPVGDYSGTLNVTVEYN
jgi:hypothetical protein